MKNILRSLFFAFVAMFTMTSITSCDIFDEDNEISYSLEGIWQGRMVMEYNWDGAVYSPSYTRVCFYKDPRRYAKGDGYWVDYFVGRTPWQDDYYANHIEWRVRNEIIEIYLIEDDTYIYIRNYVLTDNHFDGEFSTDRDSWGEFRLDYIGSPNSGNYHWGSSFYYSKTRSIDDATDTPSPLRPKRTMPSYR